MPKNCSEIYLGLGTNLGDRKKNLEDAVAHLKSFFEMSYLSSIYQTAPRDNTNQPYFLNMVVTGQSSLNPITFLEKIKSVELDMGRQYEDNIYKGPRVIDIDILLWRNDIIREDNLTVPHESICDRAFVLIPILEINPELKNPVSGLCYKEHLERLPDQDVSIFSN